MSHRNERSPRPWSVVLAGGDGERTRPFIERWLGYHKPKQYCTFVGNRSLFQSAIDRADQVGEPRRRVSVVARSHIQEVTAQLRDRDLGIVLAQPANRGTAVGVLLALARIHAVDPGGVAVLYPSDHFVLPEEGFTRVVAEAARLARTEAEERLVLVGVVPDGPEGDYGWILPARGIGDAKTELRAVEAFVEKPAPARGEALMARGGLWNSMVVAGRVAQFWNLAFHHLPELMPLFVGFRDAVGTPREALVLDAIYRAMPVRDFSRHLLQSASQSLAVLPLRDVIWSDWGRPERIVQTLHSIGAEPAFPEERLLRAEPSIAIAPQRSDVGLG